MITKVLIQKAKEYAFSETEKFGTPPKEMLLLAEEKSAELAGKLGADPELCRLATYLIDIKLGECLKDGRVGEHVAYSASAAREFLEHSSGITTDELDKVINCVEAHHGDIPYSCPEAEIVANGDAYKFLHPRGIFVYFALLGERKLPISDVLNQVESKMDEKHEILTLKEAKEELEPYYQDFKEYIKIARGK